VRSPGLQFSKNKILTGAKRNLKNSQGEEAAEKEEISDESSDIRRQKQGERAPEDDQGRPGREEPGIVPETPEVEPVAPVPGGPGEGADVGLPGGVEPGPRPPRTGEEREGERDRAEQGDRRGPSDTVERDTGNVPGVLDSGSDYVIPENGLDRKGGWKTARRPGH